jgi:hypothetical protein
MEPKLATSIVAVNLSGSHVAEALGGGEQPCGLSDLNKNNADGPGVVD